MYKRGHLWYVKYKLDGRWVYRSLRTSNKNQAMLEVRALDAALNGDGVLEAEKGFGFEELRELYLEWAATMRSRQTIDSRLRALNRFVVYFPGLKPADVGLEHIEVYRRKYLESGVSKRSVNESVTALSAIWSLAVKFKYLDGNPFRGVEHYRESKKLPRWLDMEQIEVVLDVAERDGRNAHLFFALGIFAGLRKNEIVNAQWQWFDFERDFLHVQAGDCFEVKDHEDRTIPLHRKLHAVLLLYVPPVLDGYLIAPDKLPAKHRYRFEIRKTYERVVKAAGVPWCNPHVLRHTFASQLVAAGTDLYKVSLWLGHQSYQTTQIYAHLRPSDPDINCF